MNINIIKFETIRWASIVAVLAIVSYGFFTPISIMQAFAYNPLLIICLLAIAGFVSGRLEDMKQTADIHQLPIKNKKDLHVTSWVA